MFLPLLWYAVPRLQSSPDVTAVFERLLAVAQAVGSHAAQSDDAQLLAEMLALVSLAWVYRADVWRDGTCGDSWTDLWSFPALDTSVWAMDCEDGAKALYELALLLQRITLDRGASDTLVRLQSLCRQYTPYLCILELLSGDGKMHANNNGAAYIKHCICVLVPVEAGASCITLEATAYASGAWGRPAKSDDRDALRYRKTNTAVHAKCDAQTNFNARILIPIRLVQQERMYGRLLSLWSCANGRAVHYLANRDAASFFVNPAVSELATAVDIDLSTLQQALAPELARTPTPMLPHAAHASAALPSSRNGLVLLPLSSSKLTQIDLMEGMTLSYCNV